MQAVQIEAPTDDESDIDAQDPRPRLYGEKEIGQLLKRATELQQAEPAPPTMGA